MTNKDFGETNQNKYRVDPWVMLSQVKMLKDSLTQVENMLRVEMKIEHPKPITSLLGLLRSINSPDKQIKSSHNLWQEEWKKEWKEWNAIRH